MGRSWVSQPPGCPAILGTAQTHQVSYLWGGYGSGHVPAWCGCPGRREPSPLPPGSVRPLCAQTFKVRLMLDSEVGDWTSLEGFASLLPNKVMLEEEVWRQVFLEALRGNPLPCLCELLEAACFLQLIAPCWHHSNLLFPSLHPFLLPLTFFSFSHKEACNYTGPISVI